MTVIAPSCPVSRSQPTARTPPALLPAIPLATDLASLIASINAMIDIVRGLSTSLTVNNVWAPQLPYNITFLYSQNPSWDQIGAGVTAGFVYYKSSSGKDQDQHAYISRINTVEFQNSSAGDNSFLWSYKIPFDSDFGSNNGAPPFKEDFFERVVNVHWSLGLAVEFFDEDT